MADPTKYTVSYNFSNWQAINPTKPLPAQRVDNELANVSSSIGQTIDALKDIRRSDGGLKNGIVTRSSFASGVYMGVDPASKWVTGLAYAQYDVVFINDVGWQGIYQAAVAHTSTNFVTDFNAGKWNILFNLGGLGFGTAALRDENYFATAAEFDALGTASAQNVDYFLTADDGANKVDKVDTAQQTIVSDLRINKENPVLFLRKAAGTGSGTSVGLYYDGVSFRVLDNDLASVFGLRMDTGALSTKEIPNLKTALDAKAPLASPTFTGTPRAPMAPVGSNNDLVANMAAVKSEIAANTYGSSQSWTNVQASRNTNTTYSNSSSSMMFVSICQSNDSAVVYTVQVSVDASSWTTLAAGILTSSSGGVMNAFCFGVPKGTFYRILRSTGGTVNKPTYWLELS